MRNTPTSQFNYIKAKNGIAICNYIGNDKKIVIPEYYKDENGKLQEIKIVRACFRNNKEIEEIIMPNTIKKISDNIFENCINLKKVTLSDNIDKIPEKCFYNCKKLEEINIPKNLIEISAFAFEHCTNLKKIIIPKTINKIQSNAFDDCPKLEIKNFENKHIKIENNNIYHKTKELNTLTSSYQKNDTLIINEDERISNIKNNNIKTLIVKNNQLFLTKTIDANNLKNLILLGKNELDTYAIINSKIKNLYITPKIKHIAKNAISDIRFLYFKGNQKEFYNKKEFLNIKYKNLIYQDSIKELLERQYDYSQINQILKGYEKGLFLNQDNEIDDFILREIVNHINYQDMELYDILNRLKDNNVTGLDKKLEIENFIQTKIRTKDQPIKTIEIEK